MRTNLLVVVMTVLIVLAGLTAIQVLIGVTPVELSPTQGGKDSISGYWLTQTGPFSARLTLFGGPRRNPPLIFLIPVSYATRVHPLRTTAQVLPSSRSTETLEVRFRARPGTYKLGLAGEEPFGLVSVGQRADGS